MEIERARNDQNIWEQVLERALKDAIVYRSRYGHLKELTLIKEAIDTVEKKYKKENKE